MKTTFNTLKKYARKGSLYHTYKGEFSGMTDCMDFNTTKEEFKTTLEDLVKFKTNSRNFIKQEEDGSITLSNCCYYIKFNVRG